MKVTKTGPPLLLFGILTVLIIGQKGISPESFLNIFFTAYLILISLADIKNLKIPNKILIMTFANWVIFQPVLSYGKEYILRRLMGALGYFVFFFIMITLFAVFLKRKIMGMGDVKLIAVITLYIGMTGMFAALVISCIAAMIFVLVTGICNLPVKKQFPFGPFIAIGSICVLLYKTEIFCFFAPLLIR